ncbi:sialic acid-binding Ig-like lectin 5 [Sparus aurata]|uniref:Sialic acid-binding Ig-like lectin 5 n=1 Tax=Sparus aurata TaxID=8175 RepID=A0A671Y2G0_SPAAU|nr:sialic acid-binding Ig-like lectin 5 [Sparus aurata]
MFPLIWMTLLFTERSSFVNTVASPGDPPEISAVAGLCVVIPCNLTADSGFTLESAAWYKCEQNCTDSELKLSMNNTNSNAQPGFRGRVSLLEPDLGNCSIIINDLTSSDSGSYQLIVLNGTTQGFTFHRAVKITVQDLTQKPTVTIPPLTEGQQTTLTCTAPGLCSGSVPAITWTWSGRREKSSHIAGNITASKTENVTGVTQRHSSTLTFNSSAEHHGTNVTCKVSFINNITTEETVTLNVTYVKKPEITGRTTLNQGDTLKLTCSAESFPPASVIWTQVPSNKDLHSRNETYLQNNNGTATLVFSNVTTEHARQYTCKAKHLSTTLTVNANVTVTLYPKILRSSGCNQSESLVCMCISQGFPLPNIEWPLLQNHSNYFVSTAVSNDTINSTIVLTVKDRSNTGVECVSSNKNGEVKEILIMNQVEKKDEGQIKTFLRIVTSLEIIVAFLIGALLSAITCCFVRICHRKKRRKYENHADTLEMATILENQMISGAAAEVDHAIDQETAEAGQAGAVGKSDVEYSHLDFSQIKRQTPAEAGATQGKAETEYAEIKREKVKARQDAEGKVEEEMTGKDEEAEHGVRDEEESEDVAVYSTVKDVMDQIDDELSVS